MLFLSTGSWSPSKLVSDINGGSLRTVNVVQFRKSCFVSLAIQSQPFFDNSRKFLLVTRWQFIQCQARLGSIFPAFKFMQVSQSAGISPLYKSSNWTWLCCLTRVGRQKLRKLGYSLPSLQQTIQNYMECLPIYLYCQLKCQNYVCFPGPKPPRLKLTFFHDFCKILDLLRTARRYSL